MTRKNVPKLRFKGFVDDWEQRKLGRYVNIRSGLSPSNFEVTNRSGNLFIKVDDLNYSNRVQLDSNLKVNIHQKYQKIKKGSTLFPKRGAAIMTNKIRILGEDSYMDTNMMALEPDGIVAEFLYIFISRTGLYKIADTSTIPQINNKHIEPYEISLPNLNEQVKIGKFFKRLDDIITLHQCKLDALKSLKQALTMQLFPENNKPLPRLRFIGFDGNWEQSMINNVADRYDNLRVPVTASERIPGNTPYFGANGIQDYVSGYTHDGEFILVAEDGANDLKNYPVHYVNEKVWVNNHAHVLQAKQGLADNKFLMNAIKQINVEPFLVGGGRAKLNADIMMKLKLYLPILKEQRDIGNFFEIINNLIILHQTKLEQLNTLKKAYLKIMFV